MLADPINTQNSIQLARKFSNTMRHIDDLLILNNSSFEKEIPNINWNQNEQERVHQSYISYLDITIFLFFFPIIICQYDMAVHINSKMLMRDVTPYYQYTTCIH